MFFIIIFFLSLPITLYYNYVSVRLSTEQPPIARSPFFPLFHATLVYGSIAGLWYSYNWEIALFALITSWIINSVSLKIFVQKYINKTVVKLMNSDWFEKNLDQNTRLNKAYEYAKSITLRNISRKGI